MAVFRLWMCVLHFSCSFFFLFLVYLFIKKLTAASAVVLSFIAFLGLRCESWRMHRKMYQNISMGFYSLPSSSALQLFLCLLNCFFVVARDTHLTLLSFAQIYRVVYTYSDSVYNQKCSQHRIGMFYLQWENKMRAT